MSSQQTTFISPTTYSSHSILLPTKLYRNCNITLLLTSRVPSDSCDVQWNLKLRHSPQQLIPYYYGHPGHPKTKASSSGHLSEYASARTLGPQGLLPEEDSGRGLLGEDSSSYVSLRNLDRDWTLAYTTRSELRLPLNLPVVPVPLVVEPLNELLELWSGKLYSLYVTDQTSPQQLSPLSWNLTFQIF